MTPEELQQWFLTRTHFLQACYRSEVDWVGMLKGPDWRILLLDELNKSKDIDNTPPDVECPADQSWSYDDELSADTQLLLQVAKLLQEHLFNRTVFKPLPANWEDWASWEIRIYYDATVLEIIAATPLPGEPGIHAFKDSVRIARAYYAKQSADNRVERLFVNPSWQVIQMHLLEVPASLRITFLQGLLTSWTEITSAIAKTKTILLGTAPWVAGLVEGLNEAAEKSEFSAWQVQQEGPQDPPCYLLKFLDPDRVARVKRAIEANKEIGNAENLRKDTAKKCATDQKGMTGTPVRTPGANELLPAASVNAVDEAKRAFIDAGLRRLRQSQSQPQRAAVRAKGEKPGPLTFVEGSEDCWKARAELERIWWASFEQTSGDAFRLAKAVYGSQYAYFKASRKALGLKDKEEPNKLREESKKPTKEEPKKARVYKLHLSQVNVEPGSNAEPGSKLARPITEQRSTLARPKVEQGIHDRQSDAERKAVTPPTKVRVVVFGAGIAGLTAAHELAERGFEVTVIEKVAARAQDDHSVFNEYDRPVVGLDAKRTETVQVGGLARTQWDRDVVGPKDSKTPTFLPGEHGYRFFPSFYRHVFDTMKRTPLPGTSATEGRYASAFDQLQPTVKEIFARQAQDVPLSRDRPGSLEAFRQQYVALTQGLGFEQRDLARFFFKLLRYMMSCSERRTQYENQTLFQFIGGDTPGFYSDTFSQTLKATPKALVAMDAEQCDARTQLNAYIQLLMDQILGSQYTDGILRAATSIAWFEPWRTYLESIDVVFVNGELLSVGTDKSKGGKRVSGAPYAIVEWGPEGTPDEDTRNRMEGADYFVIALDAVGAEQVTFDWDFEGVPREIRNFTSYVDRKVGTLERYVISIGFPSLGVSDYHRVSRREGDEELRRLIARTWSVRHDWDEDMTEPPLPLIFRSIQDITGEIVLDTVLHVEYVTELRISLWFETAITEDAIQTLKDTFKAWTPAGADVRLVSHGQRAQPSTLIHTPRFPTLMYGASPSDRFQTFTGVQYYLAEDFKLVRGFVYFPDSEWGLSAISQSQFWWNTSPKILPKEIRGVFSVDIGNTQSKSNYTRKSLVNSSRDDIIEEVWRQVAVGLRSTRGPTSVVTSLPIPRQIDHHVDLNLLFARERLCANFAPFLASNAGDWDKRPRCMPWVPGESKFGLDAPRTDAVGVWQAPYGGYRVHADRFVFCGTYMRTFTRLTTMEAANESARHAVNAILSHMAYATQDSIYTNKTERIAGDYCDIWDPEKNELDDLEFFKRIDLMLFRANKPCIADILRFDQMADIEYPSASDGQALLASLLATSAKDWGVQPVEVAGALNGLTEVVRRIGIDLGPTCAGMDSPLLKLMSMLGLGKSASSHTKEPR